MGHIQYGPTTAVLWKFPPSPGLCEQSGFKEVCNEGGEGGPSRRRYARTCMHHLSTEGPAKNRLLRRGIFIFPAVKSSC